MNHKRKAELVSICSKEFFLHPNWGSLIELLEEYINDLTDVKNIDTDGKSSDEIATELKARQLTHERINNFIEDTLTIKKAKESVPTTTRKYR